MAVLANVPGAGDGGGAAGTTQICLRVALFPAPQDATIGQGQLAVRAGPDAQIVAEAPVIQVVAAGLAGRRERRYLEMVADYRDLLNERDLVDRTLQVRAQLNDRPIDQFTSEYLEELVKFIDNPYNYSANAEAEEKPNWFKGIITGGKKKTNNGQDPMSDD